MRALNSFTQFAWIAPVNDPRNVKDVTMGEDKSTVHLDQGPKIMAALGLLRRAGISTIAARMRYNSIHPEAALQLLSLSV